MEEALDLSFDRLLMMMVCYKLHLLVMIMRFLSKMFHLAKVSEIDRIMLDKYQVLQKYGGASIPHNVLPQIILL